MSAPGSLSSLWGPAKPHTAKHHVAAVDFKHNEPAETAIIECSCGHKTTVRQWSEHSPRLGVKWSEKEPGWHEQRTRRWNDD